MSPAIGIVAALTAEARTITGPGPWQKGREHPFRRSRLDSGTYLTVVKSGPGMERASSASRWLRAEGVVVLGVTGISGGLNPSLEPGDLILADSIMEHGGDTHKQVWEETSGFVKAVRGDLLAKGIRAHGGTVITVRRPLLSAREKQALFTRTGALAVDMESAAVAATAVEAGLPFFALRAVCDPAARSIPVTLVHCLDQSGGIRLAPLFRGILRSPTLVFDILRLKRDFTTALASLKRAWHIRVKRSLPSLLDPGVT
ncbi:MAG: hypothetical protein JRH00_07370 [Deltaproteobacteria bacterium]|nr:hypothetical protein [Deltaproteobacteria bacterium]MBW2111242.1 hypothetical protein [Deltaproteobacteria bacterium]